MVMIDQPIFERCLDTTDYHFLLFAFLALLRFHCVTKISQISSKFDHRTYLGSGLSRNEVILWLPWVEFWHLFSSFWALLSSSEESSRPIINMSSIRFLFLGLFCDFLGLGDALSLSEVSPRKFSNSLSPAPYLCDFSLHNFLYGDSLGDDASLASSCLCCLSMFISSEPHGSYPSSSIHIHVVMMLWWVNINVSKWLTLYYSYRVVF